MPDDAIHPSLAGVYGGAPPPEQELLHPSLNAAAVRSGYYTDPATVVKAAQSARMPWEDVAPALGERAGEIESGYKSDLRLQQYRDAYAGSQESNLGFLLRRSVPVGSAVGGLRRENRYAAAVEAYKAGKATDDDFEAIAQYERLQQIDKERGIGRGTTAALAHLPAILGEGAGAGRIIKYGAARLLGYVSPEVLAARAAAAGKAADEAVAARRAAPVAERAGMKANVDKLVAEANKADEALSAALKAPATFGSLATKTVTKAQAAEASLGLRAGATVAGAAPMSVLMPSMYLENAGKRAVQNGGEWTDKKNLIPAMAFGWAQTAVLGSMQAFATEGSALAKVAKKTGLGLTEQASLDVAAQALTDAALSKGWGIDTGYGLVGDLVKKAQGKESDFWKHLVSQAAVFGAFSGMHVYKESPKKAVERSEDAMTSMETALKGMSEVMADPVRAAEATAHEQARIMELVGSGATRKEAEAVYDAQKGNLPEPLQKLWAERLAAWPEGELPAATGPVQPPRGEVATGPFQEHGPTRAAPEYVRTPLDIFGEANVRRVARTAGLKVNADTPFADVMKAVESDPAAAARLKDAATAYAYGHPVSVLGEDVVRRIARTSGVRASKDWSVGAVMDAVLRSPEAAARVAEAVNRAAAAGYPPRQLPRGEVGAFVADIARKAGIRPEEVVVRIGDPVMRKLADEAVTSGRFVTPKPETPAPPGVEPVEAPPPRPDPMEVLGEDGIRAAAAALGISTKGDIGKVLDRIAKSPAAVRVLDARVDAKLAESARPAAPEVPETTPPPETAPGSPRTGEAPETAQTGAEGAVRPAGEAPEGETPRQRRQRLMDEIKAAGEKPVEPGGLRPGETPEQFRAREEAEADARWQKLQDERRQLLERGPDYADRDAAADRDRVVRLYTQAAEALPEAVRRDHVATFTALFDSLPDYAKRAAGNNLKGFDAKASLKDVGLAVMDAEIALSAGDPQLQARMRADRKAVEDGDLVIAGALGPGGRLIIDGGGDLKVADLGRHALPREVKAEWVVSHELGHAVDGGRARRRDLSSTTTWMEAFHREINHQPGEIVPRLSDYATTHPEEGFAEFFRLVHASDVPHAQIRAEFPLATKFFEGRGLWPKTERAGSGGELPIPDQFNERVELVGGAHADAIRTEPAQPPRGEVQPANPETALERMKKSQEAKGPTKAPEPFKVTAVTSHEPIPAEPARPRDDVAAAFEAARMTMTPAEAHTLAERLKGRTFEEIGADPEMIDYKGGVRQAKGKGQPYTRSAVEKFEKGAIAKINDHLEAAGAEWRLDKSLQKAVLDQAAAARAEALKSEDDSLKAPSETPRATRERVDQDAYERFKDEFLSRVGEPEVAAVYARVDADIQAGKPVNWKETRAEIDAIKKPKIGTKPATAAAAGQTEWQKQQREKRLAKDKAEADAKARVDEAQAAYDKAVDALDAPFPRHIDRNLKLMQQQAREKAVADADFALATAKAAHTGNPVAFGKVGERVAFDPQIHEDAGGGGTGYRGEVVRRGKVGPDGTVVEKPVVERNAAIQYEKTAEERAKSEHDLEAERNAWVLEQLREKEKAQVARIAEAKSDHDDTTARRYEEALAATRAEIEKMERPPVVYPEGDETIPFSRGNAAPPRPGEQLPRGEVDPAKLAADTDGILGKMHGATVYRGEKRTPSGAEAYAETRAGATVLTKDVATNPWTALEENAHHLVARGGMQLNPALLPPDVAKGFAELNARFGAKYPAHHLVTEGYASWLKLRMADALTDLSPAERAADEFSRSWTDSRPGLNAAIAELAPRFQAWYTADPAARARGYGSGTGRAPATPRDTAEAVQTAAERFIDDFENDLAVLHRLEAAVEKRTGKKLAEADKPSTLWAATRQGGERLAGIWQRDGVQALGADGRWVKIGQSLKEIMAGARPEWVRPGPEGQASLAGAYATAKHVVGEWDRASRARNAGVYAVQNAMPGDARAAAVKANAEILKRTEAALNLVTPEQLADYRKFLADADPEFKAWAEPFTQRLTAAFNATRLALESKGIHLLPEGTTAEWAASRPDYVPTDRVMSSGWNVLTPGKKGENAPKITGERSGSGEQIVDPLLSYHRRLLVTGHLVNQQLRKNAIFDRLGDMPGVGEYLHRYEAGTRADRRPDVRNLGVTDQVLRDMGIANVENYFVSDPWPKDGTKPTVEWIGPDGKLTSFRVGDRALYELLTNQQVEAHQAAKLLTGVANFAVGGVAPVKAAAQAVRVGATGLNLAFQAKNIPRDMLTFWRNTIDRASVKELPGEVYRTYGRMWRQMIDNGREYFWGKEARRDAAEDPLWNQFKAARGDQMRYLAFERDNPEGTWEGIKNAPTAWSLVKDALNFLGAAELAPRFVEFKNKLAQVTNLPAGKLREMYAQYEADLAAGKKAVKPLTDAQENMALNAAWEVTVPFNRQGTVTRAANQITPFFGPAVAGVSKAIRNFKDNRSGALMGLGVVAAARLAHWLAYSDQDWWKRLPSHDKFNNFVVDTPWGLRRLPGPRDLDVAVGGSLVTMLDAAAGRHPDFRGLMEQSLEATLPPGVGPAAADFAKGDVFGGVARSAAALGGPVATTGMDLARNVDWTGKPIVPKREEDTTSDLEKLTGRYAPYALRQLTGGRGEASLRGLGLDVFPQVKSLTRTVDEFYDRFHELEVEKAAAARRGEKFTQESEFHRLDQARRKIAELSGQGRGERKVGQKVVRGEEPSDDEKVRLMERKAQIAEAALRR